MKLYSHRNAANRNMIAQKMQKRW